MYSSIIHFFGGFSMEATIVDLRYKMKDILMALDRNESVKILYHGKEKAVIHPLRKSKVASKKVAESPLFGILKDDTGTVKEIMKGLRHARYSHI